MEFCYQGKSKTKEALNRPKVGKFEGYSAF